MDFSKKWASCDEARAMDLVSYLSSLGFEPAKIKNWDYWYLSPLRDEKTPSFKINRKLNRWYDHGLGKGGNLIDFAILYNNCTVGEFLQTLHSTLPFHQPFPKSWEPVQQEKESRITILAARSLSSFTLHRYLYQRRIPVDVADAFCKEVHYNLNGRNYFAIGFPNNAGGYELRNPFFKGSSAPKDVTTIETSAREIAVFEGFFDFLSFKAIEGDQPALRSNFLILNSLSFFEKWRAFMEKHDNIHLYLDRDKTGQNYIRQALSLSKRYKDKSGLYKGYKDLNDWMVNIGKAAPGLSDK